MYRCMIKWHFDLILQAVHFDLILQGVHFYLILQAVLVMANFNIAYCLFQNY